MFAKSFLRNTFKLPDHINWSGSFLCALFLFSLSFLSHAESSLTLTFSAKAEDETELVKNSIEKLKQTLVQKNLPLKIFPTNKSGGDLVVMSLHDIAEKIPALQVLELPFFYDDLTSIHQQIDGKLGVQLRQRAQDNGWVILEWWDEGLQVMSGNRRYDHRINLSGMEFVLLRDDPMAQRQFTALNAWSRRVNPQTSQQLLHECLVGSRSATVARIWSERLDRVHLSLSLSQHRYEAWVLLMPLSRWQTLPEEKREQLRDSVLSMKNWQRAEALKLEQIALENLKKNGMQVFELNAEERQKFVQRLPPWTELLPASLSAAEKAALLSAATVGVAASVVSTSLATHSQAAQTSQITEHSPATKQ